MYLYRTYIVTDDALYFGLSAAEKTQHATDKTDFETNHKSSAKKINELVVAETSIITDDSYTTFKGRIDGTTVLWSDVKYIELPTRYALFILSEGSL